MQYNNLNPKLSNSQLIKLKSAIKKETEVVLRLSSKNHAIQQFKSKAIKFTAY